MIETNIPVSCAEVVGLGQACVDYLGDLPFYPLEDSKAELRSLVIQCGGPASTALITLASFGIKTSFIGSISDDFSGCKIKENLLKKGVDISCLKITPGFTSQLAFITVSAGSGKRTVFWHRGTVPHLKATDVDISHFGSAKILHLDGLMEEASIKAAEQAKDMGIHIVLDAGTLREQSIKLVSLSDTVIVSEGFVSSISTPGACHKDSLEYLRSLGPETAVITLGENGSIGLDKQGSVSQKAFDVKVIDTTGAGDVYHGAYIYAMLNSWGMARCMHFASAAAALKCRSPGAQQGIPTLEEIAQIVG